MGEKIDFPLNSQRYFEQAIQFLEEHQFEKALDCLEKVYETDKRVQVNRVYTLVLYTLDRVEEALDIANDQKEFYMKEEKDTVFYTMILIKNHLFIEAEVFIQNHLSNPHSPYFEEWQNANRELVLERENVHFQMELQKKETIKELSEIETYSPMKQTEIIQNARQLTLQELQKAANQIFINSQILPRTQKAFLELLIEKEDTNVYHFQWIEGIRQVVPENLQTFEQLEILKQVTEALETKLAKNPSYINLIYTEILNDLLVLYPFVDEVVTDVDFWVESYMHAFELSSKRPKLTLPLSEEEKRMENWLNYLNQMAQRNQRES